MQERKFLSCIFFRFKNACNVPRRTRTATTGVGGQRSIQLSYKNPSSECSLRNELLKYKTFFIKLQL